MPHLSLHGSSAGADSCVMLFHLHLKQAKWWSTYQCEIEWQEKTQTPLPLSHSANEMFLWCVDTHFHQTAPQAAGVHPQGPFKIKDLVALAVKSLQGAGTSWTTALETHARALWQGRRKKGPNRNDNIWCLLFCEINIFCKKLYN